MDGELEEKFQLTACTRSGDTEGTKIRQEEGRKGGISESQATTKSSIFWQGPGQESPTKARLHDRARVTWSWVRT